MTITNNMTFYSLALKIVDECIINDASFDGITKDYKKDTNIDKELLKKAMNLAGSSLRRYLAITYRFKDLLDEYPDHLKNALVIIITNKLFSFVASTEVLLQEGKGVFDEVNANFPSDKLNALLSEVDDKTKLIPEEIEKDSPLYLSLRYNCPLWLVKMWIKHYELPVVKSILYGLTKTNEKYGIVNKNVASFEWALEQENIEDSGFYGVLKTKDDSAMKNNELSRLHKVYPFSPALNEVLNMMDIDQLRGIAFYAGCPTDIYFKLYSSFGKNLKFDFIASNEAYYCAKTDFDRLRLNNVFLYKGEPSSLIACISKPVHTMFCLPENSNYSSLRNKPEAFKNFKQDKLDYYIQKQKETLDECAKYVEEDGELLYLIPTISKKEGPSVVYDFINSRKDFTIVKSQQCFPFKKHGTSMYYALFKKVKNEETND